MAQEKKPTPESESRVETRVEPPERPVARKTRAAAKKPPASESLVPAPETTPMLENLPKEKPAEPAGGGRDRGALLVGAGLLLLGAIMLAGRLLSVPLSGYLWPFIFIVPGGLLFWTALTTESDSAEGLSILGGILSMLGFLFLAQSITGLWASWAYAWTLIAPISIGLSQMVFGSQKGRESIYRSGERLVRVGLWMFLIGFVFFELVIGISGFGLSRFGLPVIPMMLIFAGLVLLVRSFVRGR